MDLTVQGILRSELLEEAKVVAGEGGSDNKIMGITIMEAPDIANWIKGGEFILTSLYTLNTLDKEVLNKMIEGLKEKNVSAIGFKRRKKEEIIPKILIELGNRYNIPIIQLPTKVPFLDIMNPVMANIFNRQMVILKHYKEVHNKFTKLALANKELNTIIDTLSELLKNPVSVYDRKGKCIYSTDDRLNNYEILEKIQEIKADLPKDLQYSRQKVKYTGFDNIVANQVIVSVKTVNNLKIYLVISEINRELEELDYITIEHAATVISFDLVKQFSIAQVEKKFESDFIDDLINGNIKGEDELYQKANLIGLDTKHRYIICSLNMSPTNNKTILVDNNKKLKIQSILYEAVNEYFDKAFVGSRSNKVTILCDIESFIENDVEPSKNIKKILRKIQGKVNSKFASIIITAGVSNVANSISRVVEHYEESIEALELGELMFNRGSITSFDELGILRLLCKVEKQINLKNYIPKELIELLEYDKSNNSDLLYTLETFINLGCNASKAAKEMYMHYKTIMYRLDKIKTITDLDVGDHEKMLEIQIGLKILKILNNKN